MKVIRNSDGVIINASCLLADDIIGERVLCPECGNHTFENWPLGWDSHATHRCDFNGTETDRKNKFKNKYRYLFR
jgi:hypothetical protein